MRSIWRAGTLALVFVGLTASTASAQTPTSVAFGSNHSLWVAESGRVVHYGPANEVLGQVEVSGAIATDTAGDLYVARGQTIEVFAEGTLLRSFATRQPGEEGWVAAISAITVDASGDVWATRTFTGRVLEFSPTGTLLTQFPTSPSWPEGIALSGGNVYVSEMMAQRVQEFTPSGAPVVTFDSAVNKGLPTEIQMHGWGCWEWEWVPGQGITYYEVAEPLPWGIATDPSSGNLYVSESCGRVRQFTPAGITVQTVKLSRFVPEQAASKLEGIAVANGEEAVADTTDEVVRRYQNGKWVEVH